MVSEKHAQHVCSSSEGALDIRHLCANKRDCVLTVFQLLHFEYFKMDFLFSIKGKYYEKKNFSNVFKCDDV